MIICVKLWTYSLFFSLLPVFCPAAFDPVHTLNVIIVFNITPYIFKGFPKDAFIKARTDVPVHEGSFGVKRFGLFHPDLHSSLEWSRKGHARTYSGSLGSLCRLLASCEEMIIISAKIEFPWDPIFRMLGFLSFKYLMLVYTVIDNTTTPELELSLFFHKISTIFEECNQTVFLSISISSQLW